MSVVYLPAAPLFISVVVNTCDRADPLRTLLYALDQQTYSHFEVVVVVGPTRDDTIAMLADEFSDRIVLARCASFNLSASRNEGIKVALGEIIAFIDDDAVPSRTWLAQIAAAFRNDALTPINDAGTDGLMAAVTGRIHYNVVPGLEAQHARHSKVSIYGHLLDQDDLRSIQRLNRIPAQFWLPRLIGTNMAFRRDALQAVGGFDEYFLYLLEDPDIGLRLSFAGYHIDTLDHATIYHAPAASRNRQTTDQSRFVYSSNWYLEARGFIYYMLKNVPVRGGWLIALRNAIAVRIDLADKLALQLRIGLVTPDEVPAIRRSIARGVRSGFWNGLFRPRRTRRFFSSVGVAVRSPVPFLTPDSATMPAVLPLPVLARERKPLAMTRTPLRICLLSGDYPPDKTDGVARSTHTLAQGLAALGHEVHVIKRGRLNRTKVYDGAYVHEVQATRRYRYDGYPNTSSVMNYSDGVDQLIRNLEIEHEIQLVDSPLWQVEGLVTAISQRLPCVVRPVTAIRQIDTLHGTENVDTRMIGALEEELLLRASGIAVNSTATRRAIEVNYQIDLTQRVQRYTPYGTIPAPDSQIAPVAETEVPTILYVGRLEQRKGILDLFAAIPRVLGEHPNARFVLAGRDNSAADGFQARQGMTYPEYFQKMHPHLKDRVEFLGFVDDALLPALYHSCTLFVAPSLYESFGLIHVEAMNFARPVIGCRAGGTTDLIVDGETGYLVEPGSAEALAAAINDGLTSLPNLRAMGLAGRERMLSHFTHLTMAKAFVDLYDAVLTS